MKTTEVQIGLLISIDFLDFHILETLPNELQSHLFDDIS